MNLVKNSNLEFIFYHKKNLLKILIIYSIFCSLLIGNSWDLKAHLLLGKSTLNYLLSFGTNNNNNYTHYREFYSPSYWSIVYFFSQFFSLKLSFEVFKIINLIIGWLGLIGFYKLNKKLFDEKIATYSFILLYFYPIFFGHLSINPKDIVLLVSHIWIFYLILNYLDKQNKNFNSSKIILKLSIFLAIATGIQLYFIASLLPVFLLVLVDIFFFKKIINPDFYIKKFFIDIFKIFLIFYFFLVLFWIDTHSNILTKPIEFFFESFSTKRGWPYNLLNGEVFNSLNASKFYVLLMTFYKTPEYVLFLNICFIFFYFFNKDYFYKKIKFFNYKIIFIFLIILFPTFILFVSPFPVYDGLRLFLWYIPYTLIFASIALNFLILNLDYLLNKIIFYLFFFLKIYYLIFFFSYTPYQYTYLNSFSGLPNVKNIKFENDYWGVSLKELIKKIKYEFKPIEKKINVFMCSVPEWIVKDEVKKNKLGFLQFTNLENADYILLTNRTLFSHISNKKHILLCNDLLDEKILSVVRLGHSLSIFGKIKKNF